MDLSLNSNDFWYSLHGQVPGLLDWDMGNELFLPFTTDQSPVVEQNLAKYKIRVMKPPEAPQEGKPGPDKDAPHFEPNLWMWVNPNTVCCLSNQEAPKPSSKDLPRKTSSPRLPTKDEESECPEAQGVVESLSLSLSEQSPQQKQLISSPRDSEFTEEETEEQEDKSSLALKPSHKRDYFQNPKLWQANKQERKSWPRPPLNYSHLIALALRNSPSSGLNVQQIYNFTRQHFPFFWTAPSGWKNTIRHNLCFLGSFEKVPVALPEEADRKPRSCLWRLTEEGHRHFQEDTRLLASARRESIQECMSQPDLMPSLFDL